MPILTGQFCKELKSHTVKLHGSQQPLAKMRTAGKRNKTPRSRWGRPIPTDQRWWLSLHDDASPTSLKAKRAREVASSRPLRQLLPPHSNTHFKSHVIAGGAADDHVHTAVRVLKLALSRRIERGRVLGSTNVYFVLLSIRMDRDLDVLFFPRNMSLGMAALNPW